MSQSSATALAAGNFVVTWTSNNQDGSLEGVYGSAFDLTASDHIGRLRWFCPAVRSKFDGLLGPKRWEFRPADVYLKPR